MNIMNELRFTCDTANVSIREIDEIEVVSEYQDRVVGQNFDLCNGRGSASRLSQLFGTDYPSSIDSANEQCLREGQRIPRPSSLPLRAARESAFTF